MNDNELITAVRGQQDKVQMTVPVEQIIRRGRAVRARRRIPGVAGGVAGVAGVAVAAAVLMPSSHQPGHPVSAQLAAWTVTRQAGGNIYVTVRQLRDPAGLQTTLRADGVPASVTFYGKQNPSCRAFPASQALIIQVFPSPAHPAPPPRVVIHPSALPGGAGVQLEGNFQPRGIGMRVALVQSSQQCTGS
jgi:hypothetical protein